jgi:hypothetical protein
MNSKVLNPCEFPNISSKTKAKKFPPKFAKILGRDKIGDSKHNYLHMHIIKRKETLHA